MLLISRWQNRSKVYTHLNIENWPRKQLFYFFKDYENPFFNICSNLVVTALVNHTKSAGIRYSLASLYLSTRAANNIEEFRLRLRGDKVIVHDVIHPGSIILLKDETFDFCYFDYKHSFPEFTAHASRVLQKAMSLNRSLNPRDEDDDMIHYSIIPWISFTSFSHARHRKVHDSVPKVVFGKYFCEGEEIKMPVSVEVHHALMDGIHVGKYVKLFQEYLLDPGTYLS